ncbi:glycosyl transferase family 1 [Nitrospira sp. KM1]|uniref:glycosyltransferase family 4 protein n=1 Tax=Nitrospira sp. KM1 TaxID=1936990 RepID=UPI0013A79976|nr:glycosyltransferase family 4 protein [Nitrospira sp. KM1]BCA55520.1 glycosyl transferase family 1 [Nitrospira sp. KM1]
MKKIHVLYVYLGFYRDAGGEHAPLGLAEKLDRERFKFEIVTLMPTTSSLGAAVLATGCTIHELGLGIPSLRTPAGMIKTIYAFYKTFRRIRPDIVHTQSGFCNVWGRLAARLARVPVVIATINFGGGPKPRWFLRPLMRVMHSWLSTHTAAYVCVAKHLLKEELLPREWDRAEVIGGFFDLNRFLAGRTELPEIRALRNPVRPVLAVIGRLEYEKGHCVAIAAMRKIVDAVPDARLMIIGGGSLEGELKDQVKTLRLSKNVEFTGHRTQICDVMSTIDLLLIPSYNEAFGHVVLESIAAGVPLLGSRSGAFPEILENGLYGNLVAPLDPDGWADAALDIIANPAPALNKLKTARAKVLARYTKEEGVRRHADLYQRLVEHCSTGK